MQIKGITFSKYFTYVSEEFPIHSLLRSVGDESAYGSTCLWLPNVPVIRKDNNGILYNNKQKIKAKEKK